MQSCAPIWRKMMRVIRNPTRLGFFAFKTVAHEPSSAAISRFQNVLLQINLRRAQKGRGGAVCTTCISSRTSKTGTCAHAPLANQPGFLNTPEATFPEAAPDQPGSYNTAEAARHKEAQTRRPRLMQCGFSRTPKRGQTTEAGCAANTVEYTRHYYLKAVSYQATALAVLSLGLTFTDRVPIAHKAASSAHAEAFPPGH